MAEKKPWNILVEEQLIGRLNTLALKAGYASGNEFAAEALDMWAETALLQKIFWLHSVVVMNWLLSQHLV